MENVRPTKKARVGRSPLAHRIIYQKRKSDKNYQTNQSISSQTESHVDLVFLLFETNRRMIELEAKCMDSKRRLKPLEPKRENGNKRPRGVKRKFSALCQEDEVNEVPRRKMKTAWHRNFTFHNDNQMDWQQTD